MHQRQDQIRVLLLQELNQECLKTNRINGLIIKTYSFINTIENNNFIANPQLQYVGAQTMIN